MVLCSRNARSQTPLVGRAHVRNLPGHISQCSKEEAQKGLIDTPRGMDPNDPENVQCLQFLNEPNLKNAAEIKMDDLDYETHLENYKGMFGYYVDIPDIAKKQILNAAEEKAKHHHAISVFDPLRDLIYATALLEEKLTNKNAKYFMLYGAARRAHLIFSAYQEVRSIAYEKRTEPLSRESQVTLSQAINNIYIHLLGILDNFAWCLLYERQAELAGELPRNSVGLFSEKFRRQFVAFSEIADEIVVHDSWHGDVKNRRDPIAHRIPLYVPPAQLTSDQAEHYSAISKQYHDSLNDLRLDEAEQTLDQLDSIGSFLPYFIHHPEEPHIPIYPTIPADLSHLIRIGNTVAKSLLPKSN